jgi:hypothetical protein
MKRSIYATSLAILILLCSLWPTGSRAADSPLAGDALRPPEHPRPLAVLDDPSPSLYQPSAFLAGHVAVQLLFVESDGSREPSTKNWSNAQITAARDQIAAGLEWWRSHLPNARLSFDLTARTVPSSYEPIGHGIDAESTWVGDVLTRLGVAGATYFDQAYLADDRLRRERGTDWATTIFVVNSAGVPGGQFADGRFAYAYIGGPFMVVTSDAGPYGVNQMAPVVAHEFGHIFGALDQYASAATPCTQRSGYLAVPTTNSQANSCGTHLPSIMLEPIGAYAAGQIDPSALGQLGYRDSDADGLPDPLDTAPHLDAQISQPASGRPVVGGRAFDEPYPSPLDEPATLNHIARFEYRVDGAQWQALLPKDGAYDGAVEDLATTLPLYDGRHTVELRAANDAGGVSLVVRAVVDVRGVGAAPAYAASVPAVTRSQAITVSLSAPAGASAQISADPFFRGAAWVPATPDTSWNLPAADGAHTLYIRFRDANGLESPPLARDVLLDSSPPSGRAIEHTGSAPWLELQARDSGSGVAAMQVGSGAWEPFQPSLPLPGPASLLEVRLRDEAGNISAPLSIVSDGTLYLPLAAR